MKELIRDELIDLNGGYISIPKWVKGSLWFAAAIYIIDNWSDIKSGIVDGFTDGANS